MSYVLCLGFSSFQYKKKPTVQLYIDDIFLYEFEINAFDRAKQFESNKELNNKLHRKVKTLSFFYNKDYTHYLKTLDPLKNWNSFTKMLKYDQDVFNKEIDWHFFTIDDNVILKSKQLKINISSEDSNYTNGFMTLSTIYSLKLAYLMPEEMFSDPKKYFKKYDREVKQYNRNQKTPIDVCKFYKKDILKTESKPYFTLIDKEHVNAFNEDGTKIEYPENNFGTVWFGGNKNIQCDLNNNTLKINSTCVEKDLFAYDLAYAICNKYKQHENQRSNI